MQAEENGEAPAEDVLEDLAATVAMMKNRTT